jgi:hypothetical protein
MVAMSKINKARTWGLALTLIGMGIMIVGLVGIVYNWGLIGRIIAYISMILGILSVMASMAIYLWAGTVSSGAPVVECPRCQKRTKVVGMNDWCMYCHTPLSFDPKYKREPQN